MPTPEVIRQGSTATWIEDHRVFRADNWTEGDAALMAGSRVQVGWEPGYPPPQPVTMDDFRLLRQEVVFDYWGSRVVVPMLVMAYPAAVAAAATIAAVNQELLDWPEAHPDDPQGGIDRIRQRDAEFQALLHRGGFWNQGEIL
jgi:hypothetical protein